MPSYDRGYFSDRLKLAAPINTLTHKRINRLFETVFSPSNRAGRFQEAQAVEAANALILLVSELFGTDLSIWKNSYTADNSVSRSHLLCDFSSGYVAKIVIEKDKIRTENANLSHGVLNLATFDPFQKNPPISKVFREIGLADELGSGMRNTYKYTKMYSGAEPEFMEGDVFRITIPLPDVATATVGPTTTVTTTDKQVEKILDYCSEPRSTKEILSYMGLSNKQHLHKTYIKPLLAAGKLKMTIPDKPNSRNQKYIKA